MDSYSAAVAASKPTNRQQLLTAATHTKLKSCWKSIPRPARLLPSLCHTKLYPAATSTANIVAAYQVQCATAAAAVIYKTFMFLISKKCANFVAKVANKFFPSSTHRAQKNLAAAFRPFSLTIATAAQPPPPVVQPCKYGNDDFLLACNILRFVSCFGCCYCCCCWRLFR